MGYRKSRTHLVYLYIVVADRLDIQGIPAFPVNEVHGIDGWLFNVDMSPIYCPQTLGHSMVLQESGNELLYLQ